MTSGSVILSLPLLLLMLAVQSNYVISDVISSIQLSAATMTSPLLQYLDADWRAGDVRVT